MLDHEYAGSCGSFREDYNLPSHVKCCSSCHMDMAEGRDACEIYDDEQGVYYRVCCSVSYDARDRYDHLI